MFQIVDARYENCYSRPDSNDFSGIAHLAAEDGAEDYLDVLEEG